MQSTLGTHCDYAITDQRLKEDAATLREQFEKHLKDYATLEECLQEIKKDAATLREQFMKELAILRERKQLKRQQLLRVSEEQLKRQQLHRDSEVQEALVEECSTDSTRSPLSEALGSKANDVNHGEPSSNERCTSSPEGSHITHNVPPRCDEMNRLRVCTSPSEKSHITHDVTPTCDEMNRLREANGSFSVSHTILSLGRDCTLVGDMYQLAPPASQNARGTCERWHDMLYLPSPPHLPFDFVRGKSRG